MEFSLLQLFDKYHKGNKYTMMAHMNYNIPNNVSTNHPWCEFYTMDGKYMVDNSEQIGGDINEFQYYGNTYIFDIYKKKESDIRRVFIKSFKSKSVDIEEDNCAQLTYQTSSDTLNIESLNGLRGCVKFKSRELDKVEKQGTMLVYAIIDWARKKGFKKITLEDISRITCMDSKLKLSYSLFIVHTLQTGYPWYWKFGFRYIKSNLNKKINSNIEFMNSLMTNEMPFQIILNIFLNKIINERYIQNKVIDLDDLILKIKFLTDIYIKNVNNKAYDFFKEITAEYCEFMALIYDELFVSLNLQNLISNLPEKMELEL
jgi:hypothetical protein